MPVQIKELNIKLNVNQNQSQPGSPAGSGEAGKENEQKENMIKEAVEQITRILENKKER